ncbi:DUF58 domain-containing protein [Pelomonas sp. SE-A7]|uniref:DUF58 domain-containing protein n=1 Tax=Pelomonas sp. SE-A7 TaxID=3054953 RepID=UPI00259C9385|nr:DUF58 domain-containing protein [Pelomonas sp. SE-A7]MDM4765669.1 DUF58 domain-containing protein [Pelomonas sp. SE-A7]
MLKYVRSRIDAWWAARHQRRDTHAMGQNNIYILPSRPGLAFCFTLGVLLLASINDQLSLGYMLTFLLAGAGFASMHATHGNLRGLQMDLREPAPGFAGGDLQLELRVHNSGRARYGVGIRVQDENGGKGETAWCDVPAQGHALVHVRCPATRRGLLELPTLVIETRFPLGLFRAWSIWRPATRAWVYPRAEQPAAPFAVTAHAAEAGELSGGALLPGQDFEGVRAYRRGDTLRQVIWKKAALALEQGGPLWVRETRAPASQRLWLDIADTAGREWEARLSRLTAWVLAAESQGHPYGLRVPGQELDPAQGPEHRRACLELLALAEPGRTA